VQLSPIGFGGAPIGNLFSVVEDDAAQMALQSAWNGGVHYFDTAPYYGYGLSEQRLGRFLSRLGTAKATLSTKVGRLISAADAGAPALGEYAAKGNAVFDYSRDGVLRSFESSLERLQVERIDILLLHDVGAATHGPYHAEMLRQALDEALPTMAQLRAQGGCSAIGIGVNEESVCLEVMRHFDLDCILLAGRYSLLDHVSLHGVMAEARRRKVDLIIGGPYNSGLLAGRSAPGATYDYRPASDSVLQHAHRLYALCGELGIDVGAVALQFPLAHPAVVAVVAGLRSEAEVALALERIRKPVPAAAWQALRNAGFVSPDAPTP
jgi:D-threo-aldose 1-dehydrogenase